MNSDALAKYWYLWDGSSPGWVLLKVPELPGGYCVFHKVDRTLLHIESSTENDVVCKKMKENGCEVFEDMPPGNAAVSTSPV